jgi:tRNA U34 5-methylaminomethyl-2-thiouridine-forming methyltransferase MnmC
MKDRWDDDKRKYLKNFLSSYVSPVDGIKKVDYCRYDKFSKEEDVPELTMAELETMFTLVRGRTSTQAP